MYQVIICTINSGRVQRKSFDNWDAAQECSERWIRKNKNRKTYAVSIERVEQPPKWKHTGRTIAA
jgi:hypothetical protein